MPVAAGFGIVSAQAAIFTPDMAAFSQQRVLTDLLEHYGRRYDGLPVSIPIPPEAPGMFPRIQLQSVDGQWRLNAAPWRIDAFWTPATLMGPHGLAGAVQECSGILEDYAQRHPFRVGRLALVITRGVAIRDPASVLVRQFCSPRAMGSPLSRSDDFELHNHKRYRFRPWGATVNSWVRCRATVLVAGEPGIMIEQDINTLEEEMEINSFDAEAIHRFLTSATEEADHVLDLYFPPEE